MAIEKQSIIVKKTPESDTLSKAEKIARKYADRIYTHRETETSFRFRQRDDSDFKEGTFRTKIINNIVSIVYGELKENIDKSKNKIKRDNMPIPKPQGGESQNEFVSRCMSELNADYPDEKQRAAICYNAYRESKAVLAIKRFISIVEKFLKRK